MLQIQTFDQRAGGNVLYKALAHPRRRRSAAYARCAVAPVALYDPDGIAEPLLALYPELPGLAGALRSRRAAGGARSGRPAPRAG